VKNVETLDLSYQQHIRDATAIHGHWAKIRPALDLIYDASTGLKVIDPHHKTENENDLLRAQQLIKNADILYFLGFGFDQNNCKRIGVQKLIYRGSSRPEMVLYTNMGDSGRVNKDAAKALFGSPSLTLFDTNWYGNRIDKSTRDVYDAFAMDFGAPEQEQPPS
jgi:hypothetical protein